MAKEKLRKAINLIGVFLLGVLIGANTQIIHYNVSGEVLVVIFFGHEIVLIDEPTEATKRDLDQQ